MNYAEVSTLCKPYGSVPGCPHDGLGCPYGEQCRRPPDATRYGHGHGELLCIKHEAAIKASRRGS